MKKYMLLAAICTSWPGLILAGCTGATGPGNTGLTAALTGNSAGSFTGSCTLTAFPFEAQSPLILTTTLNQDNTVTLTWNWYENAASPYSIIIEYSTDSGTSWEFLAQTSSPYTKDTTYTTPILGPGNYIFKIGNLPDNASCAYFSAPSPQITIGSTIPLTMTPIATELLTKTIYNTQGTFPGASGNLSAVFSPSGILSNNGYTLITNAQDYELKFETAGINKSDCSLTIQTSSPQQYITQKFDIVEKRTIIFNYCG